jgi:hypothetical protein
MHSAYAIARHNRLGVLKVLGSIHVEKPVNRKQAERMYNLPGLSQKLNGEDADGLAEDGRRSLECSKAA